MGKIVEHPTKIEAEGNLPKVILEYFGRVNTRSDRLSIAQMKSPAGWTEPGQTPEFDEYTIVLKGKLHVKFKELETDIKAGQALLVEKGEWVQYSSPDKEGAEYIAVCLPAFSPDTVHRDKREGLSKER